MASVIVGTGGAAFRSSSVSRWRRGYSTLTSTSTAGWIRARSSAQRWTRSRAGYPTRFARTTSPATRGTASPSPCGMSAGIPRSSPRLLSCCRRSRPPVTIINGRHDRVGPARQRSVSRRAAAHQPPRNRRRQPLRLGGGADRVRLDHPRLDYLNKGGVWRPLTGRCESRPSAARIGQQLVERFALVITSSKSRHWNPTLPLWRASRRQLSRAVLKTIGRCNAASRIAQTRGIDQGVLRVRFSDP
jgi:hypothetical protein